MKKKGYILWVLLCLFCNHIFAQITASFVSMRPIIAPIIAGVVTDRLAIYLDAGNTASYAGSGSSWIDLTAKANSTLSNAPSYAATPYGNIAFNGSNQNSSSSTVDLDLTAGFTIEMMVKFNALSTNQGLMSLNDGNNKYINLWYSSASGLRFEVGSGQSFYGTNNMVAGTWYYITATFDPATNTARLYRNGVLDVSATKTAPTAISAPLVVGDYSASTLYPLNGNVAITRVYTKPLSSAEIANNYNFTYNQFNIIQSGLMVNFINPPSSGSTWNDASGNSKNATLNGSPSYVSNNGGGIKLNNPSYTGVDFISVPYNIASTTFTVEILASFNPTSFWAPIWANEGYSASKGYFAYQGNATNINWGSPTTNVTAANITASNAIRHWVFVVNGTSRSLYLNGSQLGTTSTGSNPAGGYATGNFYFGSRHSNDGTGNTDRLNSSNSTFYPVFYQMRIYNKSLTASEITNNFNASKVIS